jgi:hypothetical protein
MSNVSVELITSHLTRHPAPQSEIRKQYYTHATVGLKRFSLLPSATLTLTARYTLSRAFPFAVTRLAVNGESCCTAT